MKENINAKEWVGQGVFVKWSKMKREIPLFDIMEMSSSESELWGSLEDVFKSPKYPASFDRSLVRSPLSFLQELHSAWLKGDENHQENSHVKIKKEKVLYGLCWDKKTLLTTPQNDHKFSRV